MTIRIAYDAGVDALGVVLAKGKGRIRTLEVRPGVHLDFDAGGRCVALELLDASVHIPRTTLAKYAAPAARVRTATVRAPRKARRPK